MNNSDSVLVKALTANAIFSASSGILILAFENWLALQIAGPSWLFSAVSIGLLIFAVQLILMARNRALADRLILQVIFSDVGWVVLTLAAILSFVDNFSSLGVWLVVSINLIVSVLAYLQYVGYKREKSQASSVLE